MSQQPPPGGPASPQPTTPGLQPSGGTPQTNPAESSFPAETPATSTEPTSEVTLSAPAAEAQTSTEASEPGEEATIEAQGVSPDSEAPAPSTPAPHPAEAAAQPAATRSGEPTSVISPPRGAPSAQTAGAPPVVIATPSAPDGAQVAEPVPATVQRSADDIVYTPFALSVGDGFKLGCGLVLALFVTAMVLGLLAAVVFLIASLAGFSLPIGAIGK